MSNLELIHDYHRCARGPWGSSRLYEINDNDQQIASCLICLGLTHIVHAPLVRVLACRLVLEQREQQLLSERRVRVEEERPGGEDHVDRVHVL